MNTLEIQSLDYQVPVSERFRLLARYAYPVWLDSGYPASHHGRYDLISALPTKVQCLEDSDETAAPEFLQRARTMLDGIEPLIPNPATPFQGGLIGYLGYDMARAKMGLTRSSHRLIPHAVMGLYHWAIIYDHVTQSAQLIIHPECPEEIQQHLSKIDIASKDASAHTKLNFQLDADFSASISKEHYLSQIHRIKDYITAGDIYQANFAQHFSAPYQGDPLQAYLEQRLTHPAPYSAFMRVGENAILSHSPEQFIQIQGREIQTSPIKGTAPRSSDARIDQRNADVLVNSTKDRAENLMIVDLLRNDLGMSCEPGSIRVPKLFELQSFSNVHHLVSEVRGQISDSQHPLDVLIRCHPGGSITGAPKRRSMEVIDELETHPRSLYCGSIGYLSCCGNTNSNIAIRTLIAEANQHLGGTMHCWGGGGIVADSDAEREYQETLHKVGPIMNSMTENFLYRPSRSYFSS